MGSIDFHPFPLDKLETFFALRRNAAAKLDVPTTCRRRDAHAVDQVLVYLAEGGTANEGNVRVDCLWYMTPAVRNRVLNELFEAGYIARKKTGDHYQTLELSLTEKGVQAVARIVEDFQAAFAGLVTLPRRGE